MEDKKIIIAIPVRLNSKRLPRKVLLDLAGKTILNRVYDQCKKALNYDEIVICTSDEEIKEFAQSIGSKVLLTPSEVKSGSERLSSISDNLLSFSWGETNQTSLKNLAKRTFIINVQGDQPFIDPEVINQMINIYKTGETMYKIITPIYKLKSNDIHNPSIVKTLVSNNHEALYFSRSAIPHIRGIDQKHWHDYHQYWGHVGIYGYRLDILKKLRSLPVSKLENAEKLEQLRFIDAGIVISTFEVTGDFFSVDTQEDLNYARKKCIGKFNKN